MRACGLLVHASLSGGSVSFGWLLAHARVRPHEFMRICIHAQVHICTRACSHLPRVPAVLFSVTRLHARTLSYNRLFTHTFTLTYVLTCARTCPHPPRLPGSLYCPSCPGPGCPSSLGRFALVLGHGLFVYGSGPRVPGGRERCCLSPACGLEWCSVVYGFSPSVGDPSPPVSFPPSYSHVPPQPAWLSVSMPPLWSRPLLSSGPRAPSYVDDLGGWRARCHHPPLPGLGCWPGYLRVRAPGWVVPPSLASPPPLSLFLSSRLRPYSGQPPRLSGSLPPLWSRPLLSSGPRAPELCRCPERLVGALPPPSPSRVGLLAWVPTGSRPWVGGTPPSLSLPLPLTSPSLFPPRPSWLLGLCPRSGPDRSFLLAPVPLSCVVVLSGGRARCLTPPLPGLG